MTEERVRRLGSITARSVRRSSRSWCGVLRRKKGGGWWGFVGGGGRNKKSRWERSR